MKVDRIRNDSRMTLGDYYSNMPLGRILNRSQLTGYAIPLWAEYWHNTAAKDSIVELATMPVHHLVVLCQLLEPQLVFHCSVPEFIPY